MTPAFQAAISRLEGQWRNLFRRIHRIRRSAAILCVCLGLSLSRLLGVIYLSETPLAQLIGCLLGHWVAPECFREIDDAQKPKTHRGTMPDSLDSTGRSGSPSTLYPSKFH